MAMEWSGVRIYAVQWRAGMHDDALPHCWHVGTDAAIPASSAQSELRMRHVLHSAGQSRACCVELLLHSAYMLHPIAALVDGCEHAARRVLCRTAGAGGQACASAPGTHCATTASATTTAAATARNSPRRDLLLEACAAGILSGKGLCVCPYLWEVLLARWPFRG